MKQDNKNHEKTNIEKTTQRKISLSSETWGMIDLAIKKDGYKDLRHMLVAVCEANNRETETESRRRKKFRNDCSRLQTLNNKIKAGIDVERNIDEFTKEAERICATLR